MAHLSLPLGHCLPRPGPVWGAVPQRPAQASAPPRRPLPQVLGGLQRLRTLAGDARTAAQAWAARAAADRPAALAALRTALRRDGLGGAVQAGALGAVAATATEVLGLSPHPGQLLAATALLDNRLAEMATGEGKTLATALAAAVAALAGVPVHVVTANDYLAGRDCASMAPLWAALGLGAAHLDPALAGDARRAVYAQDIVYATARELAFDWLRDRLAPEARRDDVESAAAALAGQGAPPRLQRGLCMALLDEADAILLDEAELPLILSHGVPHAARRAFLWQALALARQLQPAADFDLAAAERRATLTPAGQARLAGLCAGLAGPWRRPRYRHEVVATALVGLHGLQRDVHYLVRDGQIALIDEVSGRAAPGRVWSRGLQAAVELKEGLPPSTDTETLAQTTYQRFFQRYWRLCGTSGTLWEARGELAEVYGARVVRVPPHRPSVRCRLATRCWPDQRALDDAVAARVAALQAAGRPVLVGTDSVADAQRVSARLAAAGLAHRVLDALHDADEAATVAEAGRAGRVTVATRMAGRGTDIVLDDAARAAGGLHVLSLQRNPSRRHDRQLAGRAGRQGDPGSAETWICPASSPLQAPRLPPTLVPWTMPSAPTPFTPAWWWPLLLRWTQRGDERRSRLRRRLLLAQDRAWERRLAFAGRAPG